MHKAKFTAQHQRKPQNPRLSSLLVVPGQWVETGSLLLALWHLCVLILLSLQSPLPQKKEGKGARAHGRPLDLYPGGMVTYPLCPRIRDQPQGGVGTQSSSPPHSAQHSHPEAMGLLTE